MRPRTDVLDTFSTFMQFSDGRFDSWLCDYRLKISMQAHQTTHQTAQPPELENQERETFWSTYWYQQWQQGHSYALKHLYAYLQEPCYWAAESVSRRFGNVQHSLADDFQVAISCTQYILTRYSPAYGSSLKAYARIAFSNLIRNYLRQHKVADICSDWALLRKISQRQLTQGVLAAGLTCIDSDLLIWQCFKFVCMPTAANTASRSMRQLKRPNAEVIAQIAQRYNQQRTTLSPVPPAITSIAITTSLKRSAKAVRALLSPIMVSLNHLQYEEGAELISRLGVGEEAAPMAQVVASETRIEQQQQRAAIGAVLVKAIAHLNPAEQRLLQLYYHEQRFQQEIAEQLNIKQYQVSRQLSRVRQKLLKAVADWSLETLHISIEPVVLSNIIEVVHEWLQNHYASREPLLETKTPKKIIFNLASWRMKQQRLTRSWQGESLGVVQNRLI